MMFEIQSYEHQNDVLRQEITDLTADNREMLTKNFRNTLMIRSKEINGKQNINELEVKSRNRSQYSKSNNNFDMSIKNFHRLNLNTGSSFISNGMPFKTSESIQAMTRKGSFHNNSIKSYIDMYKSALPSPDRSSTGIVLSDQKSSMNASQNSRLNNF